MHTLLAVDDNETVLAVLDLLLSPHGYVMVSATSGAQALALAAERPIDGAIVDIHMPVMNGLEVCQSLRAHAAASGRDLPVWLMTGGYSREAWERARQAGALDVFKKPFEVAELRQALEAEFVRRAEKPAQA